MPPNKQRIENLERLTEIKTVALKTINESKVISDLNTSVNDLDTGLRTLEQAMSDNFVLKDDLDIEVQTLKDTITNISLTPGDKGDKGEPGPPPSPDEVLEVVTKVVKDNKDSFKGQDGKTPTEDDLKPLISQVVDDIKDELRGEDGADAVINTQDILSAVNEAGILNNLESKIDTTKLDLTKIELDAKQIKNLPESRTIIQQSGGGSAGLHRVLSGSTVVKQGATELVIGDNLTATPTVNGVRINATDQTITGTDTQVLYFDGDDNPVGSPGIIYNKTFDFTSFTGGIVMQADKTITWGGSPYSGTFTYNNASDDFQLMGGASGNSVIIDTDDFTSAGFVKNDASGNLTGGNVAISGTDTQVLFFDGTDTPAGDAGMTYNKTTDLLTVDGGLMLGDEKRVTWAGQGSPYIGNNVTTSSQMDIAALALNLDGSAFSTGFNLNFKVLGGASGALQFDSADFFLVNDVDSIKFDLSELNQAGFVKTDASGILTSGNSIDISADTNLAVSLPITLTGDTIGFDFTTNNTWTGTNAFNNTVTHSLGNVDFRLKGDDAQQLYLEHTTWTASSQLAKLGFTLGSGTANFVNTYGYIFGESGNGVEKPFMRFRFTGGSSTPSVLFQSDFEFENNKSITTFVSNTAPAQVLEMSTVDVFRIGPDYWTASGSFGGATTEFITADQRNGVDNSFKFRFKYGSSSYRDAMIIDNNNGLPLLGVGDGVTPTATLHVDQNSASGAMPVLRLDQGDIDDSFIDFIGTTAADGSRSISTDTTEDSAKYGAIRIEINGTTKWIRIYDSES